MSNYPSVPTRTSVLPDGTALSRYLITLGDSRGDTHKALMVAERWRDTPQVKATLDLQLKAVVAPATTSDATWAGPLAAHGIASEALQLQRGASILGALEGKVRRVPFRTHVARETGTGTGGAWVAEGNSTLVVATAVLTDWQLKRSQDKRPQRLLAGMKPASKPRPFRVIDGGAR